MNILLLRLALVGVMLQADHRVGGQGVTATKGCGAFCVAIAARRAGVADVTFAHAQQLTDPDEDGDCSMAEIVGALNTLGIESLPLCSLTKTIPAGLSILHVRSSPLVDAPDHFVVAEGREGKHRFYVPPVGAGVDDDERMVALWNGDYVSVEVEEAGKWSPAFVVAGIAFGLAVAVSLGQRLRKGAVPA